MTRIRDFLVTHPFTILGTCIGVLFALFILMKVSHTDHEVQKIRDRVVVIERNIRDGKKQAGHKFVCRPDEPHSKGCRELDAVLKRMTPAQRHKVQHSLKRAKSKAHRHTPSGRPHKPTAHRPSTQAPAAPAPSSPSGGGQPAGGGSSSDDPSDTGANVQVQTEPPRIEVRVPKTSVQTPVITVEVPSADIVVQTPPLP